MQQTEFFVILDHFLPFYTPIDPEKQNFEKRKKTLEDIIILQMFIINDSHMIYGFEIWSATRQIFLSFWTVFALLPLPPNNPKNQNLEKLKKKTLEISSF